MRQVIKSEAEPGDGVFIEREQPSTAFRPMPAYGALHSSFKAQPIDELTGEGRPTKIWTNGGASTLEDRTRTTSDDDFNAVVLGNRIDADIQRPTHPNDNLSGTFAFETGLPVEGLHDSVHCITDGCGQNAPIGDRFPTDNLGSTSGPGGSTFMTETFEPAAGMNSFGESLNPVLEIGTNSGPGGTTFMTGQFEMPTDNVGGQAGPGGTTF